MKPQSQADKAYDAIEHMITSHEIMPSSLISEASLMAATGLGRTPVREALQRLSRDHMVRIHPNRGVFVPAVTVESQLRLLEIRRPLEVLAVELACSRSRSTDRDAIGELRDRIMNSSFSLDSYSETIKETHALVSQASHNEFLVDAMTPLQGLSRRFWLLNIEDEQEEIAAGAKLHTEILTAILEGDTERARAGSLALNDYLVQHAHRSVGVHRAS